MRYLKEVADDGVAEDRTCAVYFKTGYPFGDETARARKADYVVVDVFRLADFLREWRNVGSDILRDYREHIEERVRLFDQVRRALGEGNDHTVLLRPSFGGPRESHSLVAVAQSHVLEKLARSCEIPLDDLERGRNAGGAPWTTLSFWKNPPESLYWRVDQRIDPRTREAAPSLSLRHYDWSARESSERLAVRSERLGALRRLFDEAARSDRHSLVFDEPGSRGKLERDVASLMLGAKDNTVARVWSELPRIHRSFFGRLSARGS